MRTQKKKQSQSAGGPWNGIRKNEATGGAGARRVPAGGSPAEPTTRRDSAGGRTGADR